MAVVKEITGAVMPWVVMAGIAVAIYKYRDEILGWIKGEILEKAVVPPAITPEGVTIPGPAGPARDIGQSVADWLLSILKPEPEPEPYHVFTATPAERQENLLNIPGLVVAPASWLPAPTAAAMPSALAVALGLTGDPVSGYTSVMAPLAEPSPVVNVYGYPEGVYYQDGYRLIIDPQYYDVSRVDPTGYAPGGWSSVLFGTGPATWYSPALASWVKVFGL